MTDDELKLCVAALEHDHRITQWNTFRLGRDTAEIGVAQAEHTSRIDAVDAQLRSLMTMVGEVLNRLPASEQPGD